MSDPPSSSARIAARETVRGEASGAGGRAHWALMWTVWLAWSSWPAVAGASEGPLLEGPVLAAVVEGELQTARANVLEVFAPGVGGAAEADIEVQGAKWSRLPGRGRIARLLVVPQPGVDRLRVSLGDLPAVELPVLGHGESDLKLGTVTAWVGQEVSVLVRGEVAPQNLQVVLGEGRVTSVREHAEGVVVTVQPGDDRWPRTLLMGVRDLSRPHSAPVWTEVRLRARPVVPLSTLPGSRVTLSIGGRTWGPVVVPSDGTLSIPLVQEPEDRVVRVVVRDPEGNETRRTLPLSGGRAASPLAFVDGAWIEGRPGPGVWVRLPEASRGAALRCQAARLGPLGVARDRDPRVRRVALPVAPPADAWELRVRCETDEGAEVSFAVPRAEGVPHGLRVRVWPEVLSADLPVADVAVTLENALGERVEPRGRLEVQARYGEVVSSSRPGAGLRVEYRGHLVSEVGEDLLDIAWFAPIGDGPCAQVDLAVLGRGPEGELWVGLRALDALRRPLPGVRLGLKIGDRIQEEETGADGWIRMSWPAWPVGVQRVSVWVDGHRWGEALVDGEGLDDGGPGAADMVLQQVVRVDPGRVAEVALHVGVDRVDAGTRRPVAVQARFLDRNGLPAADPRPTLHAPEGTLGPPAVLEDGSFAWDWRPGPGLRPRDVRLVARSEALDLEDEVQVRIAPRELRRYVGVGAGLQTNFGALWASRVDLDLGWLLRLGGSNGAGEPTTSLVVGGGLAWFGQGVQVDLLGDGDGRVRMDVLPVQAALGVRHSRSLHTVWASASLEVAGWWGSSRAGALDLSRSAGVLPPGVGATVGYGIRVPGGELAMHLRVSSLSSQGVADSLRGWLGGVAAGASWRVGY